MFARRTLLLCLAVLVVRVHGDINTDGQLTLRSNLSVDFFLIALNCSLPRSDSASNELSTDAAAANGGAGAEEGQMASSKSDDESPDMGRKDKFSPLSTKAEILATAGLSPASNLLHVHGASVPSGSRGPKGPAGRPRGKLVARNAASKRKSKAVGGRA
ncbi:uncharacterized protein LOC144037169 isoform X1 [Vanacampus margaritifer]